MAERARAAIIPPDPWRLDEPAGAPVDPALGGPLRVGPVVSGGTGPGSRGMVVVATDALLAHAERLEQLCTRLAVDARRIAGLPVIAFHASHDPAVRRAGDTTSAHTAVRAAEELADQARVALRLAIDRYAVAEAQQRSRIQRLGENIGTDLGPVIRVLVLAGLPIAIASRLTGAPDHDQLSALRQWMVDRPEIITSPAFVEAVRAAVMGVDDAGGSALGLPPGMLGSEAAAHGFTGVEAGALLLLGTGMPLGLLREGPVTVHRVSTLPGERGPSGAVERLARVPEGDQVRIERYEAPGEPPRYIVYVGPTETFSPVARDEPWDLTSNVVGVAGLSAGSMRATEAAMHDAGITASDQVQFVGFSQGGLVATRLAADGAWNAAGLETYGAPAGNITLPTDLAGMAVRNTDDFVPALAGPQLDRHLLQVERQAFAPGSPIPDGLPAPAHQRCAYVATATAVDAARSEAVRTQIAAMDAFTSDYTQREGSRMTVMMFHADRGVERAIAGHTVTSGGSTP
jgi:hypothetical protein